MSDLVEIPLAEWDGLLDEIGVRDVYFSRAYLESAELLGQGRPVYLHAGDATGHVVFPCLVREAPGGFFDVGTPMGYGGPVATGPDPPSATFFDAYERWCTENRVVATFVRFHPLLENQRLAQGRWHLDYIGHSVGWRLANRSADELFAGMASHHRRWARKALAAGVEASPVPEPRGLDAFVSLYEDTMRRKEAARFYLFPDAYWQLLATELRDRLVRFDAVIDTELVASILCLAGGRFLHYHLGCSNERGQRAGANHLLFHAAASWAAERSFTCLHLGGGVGGFEDTLFEFKRRFDPDGLCPAYLGKAVHDADAYLALSGGSAVEYTGYFPSYRARPGIRRADPRPREDP